MSEPAEMTVHCPKCGSEVIGEKNVAYVEMRVWEWEWDAEAGQPQPMEYDTDVSPDWEVQDVERQYVCRDCRKWEGTLAELRVEGR